MGAALLPVLLALSLNRPALADGSDDDAPGAEEVLTTQLQALGLKVKQVSSSEEALEVVYENTTEVRDTAVFGAVLELARRAASADVVLKVTAQRDGKQILAVKIKPQNVADFIEDLLDARRRESMEALLKIAASGEGAPALPSQTTPEAPSEAREQVEPPTPGAPGEEEKEGEVPSAETIAQALVDKGLENVRVEWQHNGDLHVRYENRTYRSDTKALGVVLETTSGLVPAQTLLKVVPLRDELVLGKVAVRAGTYQQFLRGELDAEELREGLTADLDTWGFDWPGAARDSSEEMNPSERRFDLAVRPGLEYEIGNEVDPFESTPLMWADLEGTVGGGVRLSLRGRTELEGLGLSVSRALLTKTVRAGGGNVLLTVSVGKFWHARYGGFLEGQWTNTSDRTRLGVRVARLGSEPGDKGWDLTVGYLEREFGRYDLTARGLFGEFLATEETGGLLELERRFGESSLALGLTLGHHQDRGLVRLSFPFGPERAKDPDGFRVRTSPDLEFDYVTHSYPAGDALWDAPDLRRLRGDATLPRIRHRPDLVAGRPRPKEQPSWQPSPSLEGYSGLLRTPTADIVPDGQYVVGSSFIAKAQTSGTFRDRSKSRPTYASVGFLPGLEINLRFTFYDDIIGTVIGTPAAWPYQLDRSVSAQYRLWDQRGRLPALAVGYQDISYSDDSSVVGRAKYAVATHEFQDFRLHLGGGTGRLHGVFGGAEARLGPHTKLLTEYDTDGFNYGIRLHLGRGLTVDGGWLDRRYFTGGVSYRGRLP